MQWQEKKEKRKSCNNEKKSLFSTLSFPLLEVKARANMNVKQVLGEFFTWKIVWNVQEAVDRILNNKSYKLEKRKFDKQNGVLSITEEKVRSDPLSQFEAQFKTEI